MSSTIFGVLALLGGATPLFAQQPVDPSEHKIASIEYKPLTLWKKAKISGAYFTDPNYVSTLQFAYGYNLKDLSPDVKEKIPMLIKEGTVAPAIVSGETGNAQTISATGWPELEAAGKGQGVILLSKTNNLLGQSSSTNWFSDFRGSGK